MPAQDGRTALFMAIESRDEDMVEYLTESGAAYEAASQVCCLFVGGLIVTEVNVLSCALHL